MADQKIVRAKLRKLLKEVDMDKATQRSIQSQLEEDLGIKLDAYKKLIKDEIDAFLLAAEEEGDDFCDGDEPELEQAPAKKKQKQATGAAAPTGDGPPGGYLLQLSDKRFVTLSQYKGKWYVGVREYYNKDGELAPSAKGLSMSPEQWRLLTESMEALSAALEMRDESQAVDLGGSKRAGPSNFGGRSSLDLREYYEKGGELKPGKKGISLPPDQWAALREGAGQVTERLLAKLGGAWLAGPAEKKESKQAGAEPAAVQQQQQEEAGAAGGGEAGEGSQGGAGVALSNSRRADVSVFQGKTYVDIREFYEKDGQSLPGKKGISLPPDQFSKLVEGAAALGEALRLKDTNFEFQLSNKRKASISAFKGTYYVNIREYYEKDGELKPGQKGISLPPDQWGKLEGALGRLQQELEAAAGR